MINTLLSGILNVSMTVVNWFLTPIYNLIQNVDFGQGFSLTDLLTSFTNLVNTAATSMSWLIDALGIPKPVLITLVFVFIRCLMLKINVVVLKLILKIWDRIIA